MNRPKPWMRCAVACGLLCAAAVSHGQTVANGPYYAVPAWDQTMPVGTRFVVLSNMNNAAVLDRETGLIWDRSPGGARQPFDQAVAGCLGEPIGGRLGWRLPSYAELLTLYAPDPADPSGVPAIPTGHPFNNVQYLDYLWTSTTVPDANAASHYVLTTAARLNGVASGLTDYHIIPYWCVRGPDH